MTVAIWVQHELYSTFNTSHLFICNDFNHNLSDFIVISSHNCFNNPIHYILVLHVLLIICWVVDHLYYPTHIYNMSRFFNFFHLCDSSLEDLFLSLSHSLLFLCFLIGSFLTMCYFFILSALSAPFVTSISTIHVNTDKIRLTAWQRIQLSIHGFCYI